MVKGSHTIILHHLCTYFGHPTTLSFC